NLRNPEILQPQLRLSITRTCRNRGLLCKLHPIGVPDLKVRSKARRESSTANPRSTVAQKADAHYQQQVRRALTFYGLRQTLARDFAQPFHVAKWRSPEEPFVFPVEV